MTQRLSSHATRQAILIVVALVLVAALGACTQGSPTTPTPPAAKAPATTAPGATAAPSPTVAATKPPAAATTPATTAGDPERGKAAIVKYGCGSCHVIPGIQGAAGTVGPSLAGIAGRPQIAGVVPNNPENMVRWLMDPPAVKPGTAMPKVGATEPEARDMAAYLATLR